MDPNRKIEHVQSQIQALVDCGERQRQEREALIRAPAAEGLPDRPEEFIDEAVNRYDRMIVRCQIYVDRLHPNPSSSHFR